MKKYPSEHLKCEIEGTYKQIRLEDHVPENHLLRLIDRHISFDFVRENLRDSYSETGRPSIDPEVLLRILLIGYLYGITSERKLVEELRMHLAWRWFTGLGFEQDIPHHSTFSKNRHGRFEQSNLFQELFERIVDHCISAGFVKGEHISVDGSFIEADASTSSRIPREQLTEVAHVKRNVREYLSDLERENPAEGSKHEQDKVSTTDPDSTFFTKGDRPAHLGYFDNYLVDNQSCVIIDVEPTEARLSQETVAAREMIMRSAKRRGCFPQSIAADAGYGSGQLLAWLEERDIVSYIPLREHPAPKGKEPLYGIEHFTYDSASNSYECPEGKQLKYIGIKVANRSHIYRAAHEVPRLPAEDTLHQRSLSADCSACQRVGTTTSKRKVQAPGLQGCTTPPAKGRSTLRRAQEPDRNAACASTENEICSGAVPPGCYCPESQATC